MTTINGQQVTSANVILRMAFVQPTPPAYLKGARRAQYLSDRAWYSGGHIDYAGRMGQYAGKAVSYEDRFTAGCHKDGNFIDYVSRQGTFTSKGVAGGRAEDGTGIFGRDGVIEGEALQRLRKELRETKSIIWNGVISPRKEVADTMLSSKRAAMEFMQANFDRFLSMTHLRAENVEWYAGWHDDAASGIKHIQFAFWERKPHRTARGDMKYTYRGCLDKQALANGLELFEEHLSGHKNDIHIARDNLRKFMLQASPQDVKRSIAKDLIALSAKLPKVQGKAGYAHPLYAPYRAEVDAITQRLINDVPQVRERYDNIMGAICEREIRYMRVAAGMTNMKPDPLKTEQLRADIQVRIGNSVIGMARRFASDERAVQWANIRAEQERMARKCLAARRRKNLKKALRLFDQWYAGEQQDVLDYYRDLETSRSKTADASKTDERRTKNS